MTTPIPHLHIHPLGPDDIPAVLELWRRCGLPFRPEGRDSPAELAAQMEAARDLFVGAYLGERLVGTALGSLDGRRKGWINRVAVDPACRRRGLAVALIDRVEAAMRAHGSLISAALIESDNAASLALFEQLGFERFDAIYVRKPNRPDA